MISIFLGGIYPLGFEAGALQVVLVYAHHSHDNKTCCACGDTWPCIPATFLAEQVNAYLNENVKGPGPYTVQSPEVRRLTDFITSILGDRFDLFIGGAGWVH